MVMSFFLYMKNEKEIFYHIYSKRRRRKGKENENLFYSI